MPVTRIAELYRTRQLSPVEVVDAFLARIEAHNPKLNAFVLVRAEAARGEARDAERRLMAGEELPRLFGIPFSVKDNVPTKGVRSTSGSPLFRDFVPSEDAAVVARIKQQGGILLGKTNTPAFGWLGVTQNKLFGATPNPWNPAVTAGGSSGGAGVAATAALTPVNIGTDGGGSLRTPAAFTGTVGFKPSYGRVPNYPTGPNWSLQHLGPIARTVEDVAAVFDSCAGPDALDPYSLPATGEDFVAAARQMPTKLRVVYADDLGFVEALDPEVAALCREAARSLTTLGWTVEEKALGWPSPLEAWRVIFAAGISHRLSEFADRRDEIETGLLDLMQEMRTVPPDLYLSACLARNQWSEHPRRLFETCDLLITPTVACPPFALGKETIETIDGKPVSFNGWSPYTRPFNMTGQPAISVPAGRLKNGLPIGIQIVGPRFGDALVLAAAAAYERLRPWPTRWPSTDLFETAG
jgi:aspartyl-tRNA(Asn)/glutamyl-tRNA(Gln) amidotransferase subunit A